MTRTGAIKRGSTAMLVASSLLLASLLAASAGIASANAAAPVAATASTSSSSTVIAGRMATLTLTLRSATTGAVIPGVVVKLWSRPSSSAAWTFVASATTSSSGVASVVVAPLHNTQYEWVFAGNSQFEPVTSSVVQIWVAQAITITASHPKAMTLDIWGGVNPNEAGQIVVVQLLISGVWHNVGSTFIKRQLMPNGVTSTGYLDPLTGLTGHSYTFRATRAATSTNAAGVSATLTVTF